MIEDKTNEETQLADRNQGWSRNQAQVIVLFGATTIALYLCYRLALPVLPALAWASALAVVGHPLHAWILRRMGRPNLAAGLAVAVVVVAIVAPSFLVVQRMVQEATDGLKTIQAAGWWQAVETNSIAAPVLAWIENHIALSSAAERLQAWLVGQVSNWVKSSVWVLMELFITLFFLFYFFRDRAMALDLVRSLMPLSDAETDRIFTRVADTIYATLYGTLVVSLAQGVLGGLMFWWLGLPSPLLWGAVMALVAVVRMLGPFIVWIPAALYLALQGSWGKALTLAIWGALAISLVDNFLYPLLVGKRLQLHTMLIFISLLGGLATFGASGLILGPLVLAVTAALLDVWRQRTKVIRLANEEK